LRRSRTLDADRCLLWQAFSRDIIGFFRERSVSRDTQEFAGKEIGDAKHSCVQFGSLGVSNFGESYMSFPTKYKHHWHAFWHEKLFEKQPQPHCQTNP
jgi:hypothetical protein